MHFKFSQSSMHYHRIIIRTSSHRTSSYAGTTTIQKCASFDEQFEIILKFQEFKNKSENKMTKNRQKRMRNKRIIPKNSKNNLNS